MTPTVLTGGGPCYNLFVPGLPFGDLSHNYSVSATATFAGVPPAVEQYPPVWPMGQVNVVSQSMTGPDPSVALQNPTDEVTLSEIVKGPISEVNACIIWPVYFPPYTATVTGTVTITYQ
jgi:hypothetical protein